MGRNVRRVLLVALGLLAVATPPALAAPAGPVLVGSVGNNSSLSEAASVAVSGSYAYTTAYEGGVLTAVNIANPLNPVITGSSAVATSLFGGATVNIAGGYAYVASKNRNASTSSNDNGDGNSLTILDIHTNPAAPAIVGTLHDPANLFGAYGVAVSGTHAYVAAQGLLAGEPQVPDTSKGSFSVIDVSNPASPTIQGHIDDGSLPPPWTGTDALWHICSVFVAGNYAYVTAFNSNRLTIIDISNPASPRIVSSLLDNVNLVGAVDVAVSGNYAYVADQTTSSTQATFTVVDVSNPASPHVVGSIIGQDAVMMGAYRVRVHGSFAYVSAANANTVSAIDVSNPASPRVVGSVTGTSLYRTLGLDFSPAGGGYVIADSALQPGDPNPKYPPFTPSLTTGTIAAIQLDPAPIAVTIAPTSEPPAANAPTSASFAFAASDQIATVQCRLDGAPLGACTSLTTQQYSSLSLGSHTFTVQATDAVGTTATDSYTWTVGTTPVVPPPTTTPSTTTLPANSSLPLIHGAAAVGRTLSCTTGAWTGSAPITYAFAWTRDGNGIGGATGSTYRVARADARHRLACLVQASNAAGSTAAGSASLAPPTGSGSAGHARVLAGGAISIKVSCARIAGTVCRLSLTLTAAKHKSQRSFTLTAGAHKTIKLTLDHAGLKLLAKLHKLSGTLAFGEAGSNRQTATVTLQKLALRD